MKINGEKFELLQNNIEKVVVHYANRNDMTIPQFLGEVNLFALYSVMDRNTANPDSHLKLLGFERVLPETGKCFADLFDGGLNDSHISSALEKVRVNLYAKFD